MGKNDSDEERRYSKKRKRKEKKRSKHKKVKKNKCSYSSASRSPSLSLSSQSPSTSESEIVKDFRDRILPVEEKIDNFRELSSFYRDREQLLNYAFDLLSSDFVDIIPEILREFNLDELKAMCSSKLSTLKSNTLRDILGLERESSDDEDLQTPQSNIDNTRISNSPGVLNKEGITSDHVSAHTYQATIESDNVAEQLPEASTKQDKCLLIGTDEPDQLITSGNDNLVATEFPEGDSKHKSISTTSDKSDRVTFSSDDEESDNEVLERKLREKLLRSLLASKRKNKS